MPDGARLNYASPSKMLSEMNCSESIFKKIYRRSQSPRNYLRIVDCARDESIFKNAGIAFNLRCKDNGNYESVQDQNGLVFCVDRDGYAVTGLLQADSSLDCDQFFYYAQEDLFIDEDIDYTL